MESNELENLIKLRDTTQRNLSAPLILDDEDFLIKLYNETDQKISLEKIELLSI